MTATEPGKVLAQVMAQLDEWRAQGLERCDPLRFQTMVALADRAGQRHGAVQRRLLDRLRVLADDYACVASNRRAVVTLSPSQNDSSAMLSSAALCGPLSVLVGEMTARVRATGRQPGQPDPATIEYFRDLAVRVRIERQARQALAQAPANAGPLNSAFLAYRALALMQEQSPTYLRRFLTYLDALASLERPVPARPKGGRRS